MGTEMLLVFYGAGTAFVFGLISYVISWYRQDQKDAERRRWDREDRLRQVRQSLLLGNLEKLREDTRRLQRSIGLITGTDFVDLTRNKEMGTERYIIHGWHDPSGQELREQHRIDKETRVAHLNSIIANVEGIVDAISESITRLTPHASMGQVVTMAAELRDMYYEAFRQRVASATLAGVNDENAGKLDQEAYETLLGTGFKGKDKIPALIREIDDECIVIIQDMLGIEPNQDRMVAYRQPVEDTAITGEQHRTVTADIDSPSIEVSVAADLEQKEPEGQVSKEVE